jgi:predicted RND superfamily exporter protein
VRQDTALVAQELGGTDVFELLLSPTQEPMPPLAVMGLSARVSALAGVVGPAGLPRASAAGHRLLSFLIAPAGSRARAELFAAAETLAHEAGWPEAHATGLAVSVARDSNAFVRAQGWGILATLASLWIVMSLGFRSFGLGLLGLVPNGLPVLCLYGALGLAGRPLTVASSMIGTVMLGLIVDSTIHILHAWRSARGSAVRRVARALERVGRPITVSTVVLCLGFSAGLLGGLVTTREFAALAVSTLIVAWLTDLVLLPTVLVLRRPSLSRDAGRRVPVPTP